MVTICEKEYSMVNDETATLGAITYDDFDKVHMRIGRILRVEDFPKARKPAYKLWIDFGEYGEKRSSAQATKLYTKEELVNRLIVAVTNFPPRQIADFISEVLVLGVDVGDGEIALLQPDRNAPLGGRIF
jgi:tRNA-binding protein